MEAGLRVRLCERSDGLVGRLQVESDEGESPGGAQDVEEGGACR